jgi:hypothetical protein
MMRYLITTGAEAQWARPMAAARAILTHTGQRVEISTGR